MKELASLLIASSSAIIPSIKTYGTSHIPMNLGGYDKELVLDILLQASTLKKLTPLLWFSTRTSLFTDKIKSHTPKWFANSVHKKMIPIAPASLLVATVFATLVMLVLPQVPWNLWNSSSIVLSNDGEPSFSPSTWKTFIWELISIIFNMHVSALPTSLKNSSMNTTSVASNVAVGSI